ncbi:NAD kinase [Propioniciclava soli]|uniref:NAD kinase n=1 Tax=Propioniciclava soli TaxID=2775081 RepID=UPI001E6384A9
MTQRDIALVVHPGRPPAVAAAVDFVRGVAGHAITCWVRGEGFEPVAASVEGADVRRFDDLPEVPVELVVVFGGDGTILRAAEWAVPQGFPLLGVNLGHVGFLAELEPSQIHDLCAHVIAKDYTVEERLCLDVELRDRPGGDLLWRSFAGNEVSLEKAARERMIEVVVDIDGHPLSRWGTDGVLVATPTGSTAYAFSAQGPVLWPDLDALLVVPLLAHALFARPLVLSPTSTVVVSMLEHPATGGVLWCDGRRSTTVPPLSEVTVRRSEHALRLVRTTLQPFVQRLVAKFDLPVHGWRGQAERRTPEVFDAD